MEFISAGRISVVFSVALVVVYRAAYSIAIHNKMCVGDVSLVPFNGQESPIFYNM